MSAQPGWRQFLRCRQEASWNAANPETAQEWNLRGGATGWIDLFDQLDSAGLQSNTPLIFPQGRSGGRDAFSAAPVPGAQEPVIGSLTMPVYPELSDRFIRACMGSVTRTPTAGVAARASVAFASLATLDTQPTSEEILKFVISSSTAATGAVINVIQSGVTVESINIGTSVASVDGDYYMKKPVANGTVNNVTFTVSGSVTAGNVVVSGIKYVSANHKFGSTAPSLVIEQAGRVEAGGSGYSEFFSGVKIPKLQFAYQRSEPQNLLLMTAADIVGRKPAAASTSTTFQDDAALLYRPIAAWMGAVQIDDAANAEIVAANININSNDELYPTSSGSQAPNNAIEGQTEAFGTLTVIPSDASRWTDYLNATARKLEIEFLSSFMVNASTPFQFKFTFTTVYLQTYTRNLQSMAQGAEIAFRAIRNTSDSGPCQIDTRSRLPA